MLVSKSLSIHKNNKINNIQLSPEGEVNSGGYNTEMQSIEVYIHRSSPTLGGIAVLEFTKSDG